MASFFLMGVLLAAASVVAHAQAMLNIHSAQATQNQITVPITLDGDVSHGVASLNFELSYDPQRVRIIDLDAGLAAEESDKQVQWHEVAPGRVNVVLTGFNQETLTSGHIALLTLESLNQDTEATRLHIRKPTFSAVNGDTIPSQGSTGTVTWTEPDSQPAPTPGGGVAPPIPPMPTPKTPRRPPAAAAPVVAYDSSTTGAEGAHVPASVQRRLAAARDNAEAAKVLLGKPRNSLAGLPMPQKPAAPEGSATHPSNGAAAPRTIASKRTDVAYTALRAPAAATLKKNLENADQSGHNKSQLDTIDTRPHAWYRSMVTVGIAVAFVAAAISVRRM